MKYLKTFESIDPSYEEITYPEWAELMLSSIDFRPSEIKKISSILPIIELVHGAYDYLTSDWRQNGHHKGIDINYLPDEWYLVWDYVGKHYYKCDQFEGLMDYLESYTYQ